MSFGMEVAAWFADPTNWTGPDGLPSRTLEHLELCALATLTAALVAVPSGLWFGHRGRGDVLAAAVANVGRAIPSFAAISLLLPLSLRAGLGLGFWPTLGALFILAVPPMFTSTVTAIRGVPRDVVESARGMGMRGAEVLAKVELPLGVPVIVAGIRIAAVQVVATATLGPLVGFGGLGRYIIDGIALRDFAMVFAGAVSVAVLAVLTELAFGVVERVVAPRRTAPAPA
ncbi:MAG TPA: ABC transporter permease [Actinomycetota bacterium]|nr:ABC transporter permease [Actinomycetota bacterium]